ncbi:MAG: hypothetical protein K6G26_07800 [Lachnospiraceae bacterium]|nr:hypothetical protein [Lachnospiraceae bacterium]
MSLSEILEYEYDNYESRKIVPFAYTFARDKWVWILNENGSEYNVGFCSRDLNIGNYYAKNTEDAILRNILDYVSNPCLYIDEAKSEGFLKSEAELKRYLIMLKATLRGIIRDEYVELIGELSKLKPKKFYTKQFEWYALFSKEEYNELINKYIYFDLLDKEFVHYEQ